MRGGHWISDKRRRSILQDGEAICHLCGLPGANSIDHIIPRSKGGGDDTSNLLPAHLSCNSRRGARPIISPIARASLQSLGI